MNMMSVNLPFAIPDKYEEMLSAVVFIPALK